MAKRYLESSLWDKSWFRQLHPKLKLFYYYMISKCNHAGVWSDVDIELAEFQIGMPINEEEILKELKDHIEVIKPKKWYIHKFVKFQYGELNPNVRAHASVIKILNENNLNVNKGLDKGLKQSQTVKDKDKDKYKDKDLVKDNKVKEKEMDTSILEVSKEHKKTIGYRRTMFLRKISEHAEKYPKEMRINFADYWTESGGNKMRWEKEKVFDVSRRLARWAKNDFSGNNVSKSFKLDATGNAFIAYCPCGQSDFYDKNGLNGDSVCCKKKLLPEHPKKRV